LLPKTENQVPGGGLCRLRRMSALRSTRQDAQINYLSTLSIFRKQTTYLATLPKRSGKLLNSIYPISCISSPPQNRHPERSASQIYRKQRALWRGVEGPRRCLLADAHRSFPAANYNGGDKGTGDQGKAYLIAGKSLNRYAGPLSPRAIQFWFLGWLRLSDTRYGLSSPLCR
jgi:hypothetical protein